MFLILSRCVSHPPRPWYFWAETSGLGSCRDGGWNAGGGVPDVSTPGSPTSWKITSWKTNSSSLKINGWKMISYWNWSLFRDMLVFKGVLKNHTSLIWTVFWLRQIRDDSSLRCSRESHGNKMRKFLLLTYTVLVLILNSTKYSRVQRNCCIAMLLHMQQTLQICF